MFGRGAGTGRGMGRGRNATRKAPGTGMKARTRRARDIIQGRKANKAAGVVKDPLKKDLMPKVKDRSGFSPSEKLIKKTAAANRAKARAKAVSAGRPAPKTGAQKAMAQKRRANALKRKQAMQARKGKI